jgi:hypothetical protein
MAGNCPANPLRTPPSVSSPLISFIQPIVNVTFLSYSQRLNLVKLYIDANLGQEALVTLKPLMRGTPHYEVMLLAAQSYAELESPIESLHYYELARSLAKSDNEREITLAGINKLQNWINASYPSLIPPIYTSDYYQSIQLIKKYLDENKGNEALRKIKLMMTYAVNFDIYFLTAQAYAESDDPQLALYYYQLAQAHAKSNIQMKLAKSGIDKMHMWLAPTIVHQQSSNELVCKKINNEGMSCIQRAQLARQYLDRNKAKRAIKVLKPLLTEQSTFETRILAAQSYAENNQPRLALVYYQSAFLIARKPQEQIIALFGIGKMEFWLGHYYAAKDSYQRISINPINIHNFELAKAGFIKSLAYADRPISGYHAIPTHLVFTTPEMVVAAAQTTLWADQSDITKNILTKYQSIAKTIDPNSPLGRDLQDIQWQTALNTNPNVLTPSEFYSKDSEDFSVLRSTLDYNHYWAWQYQSSIGFVQSRYKQFSSTLNAEGIYLRQKWRPTRELTFNGKIEPTTYQLWRPFLWLAHANYRPNDFIGAQFLVQKEVIETFPAFDHHITDDQYAVNLFLSPLPYFKINGSINRLNISDNNVRNGYFISATSVLSTVMGLNLTLQRRGYTDKFLSPNYFSPNQYSANTAILRLSSKTHSVWHYYVDGGIGNQNIGVTEDSPTATSPTQQIGVGLNGPINDFLILNAYYTFSRQASAFLGSPDYRYQYGGVSLNILL